MKLYLNEVGLVCALGNYKADILKGLLAGNCAGLIKDDSFGRPCRIGKVQVELPETPKNLKYYDCRNNQLLLAALDQITPCLNGLIKQYGKQRIGVVLGTSTSGVRATELALVYQVQHKQLPDNYHYKQQQMGGGAEFLASYLGLTGPCVTLSTACSSSGKAMASARRLIRLGLCDAVLVGGADSLCSLTINGFAALESLSADLCRPFAKNRDGINIGEAASLFLLSRTPAPIELTGIGATSDAHHFSAPDPTANQVIRAMQLALAEAQLSADQIDYLNLHGTGTILNDAMESKAVHEVFLNKVACSSTKAMTGHSLGAAAALELAFCWLLLNDNDPVGKLPPNANNAKLDSDMPCIQLISHNARLGRPLSTCQSNSFAFGGNNVSIIISRGQ